MKEKLFLTLGLSLLGAAAHAQAGLAPVTKSQVVLAPAAGARLPSLPAKPGPQLVFAEKKYDFGSIKSGTVFNHSFKFTNVGDQPLVISSVSADPECTALCTKEPVAPGKSSEIFVSFRPPPRPRLDYHNANGNNRV